MFRGWISRQKSLVLPVISPGSSQKSFFIRRIGIILLCAGVFYIVLNAVSVLLLHDANILTPNTVSFSEFDNYDIGCLRYSIDSRIEAQRRILQSVRTELVRSSRRLDEVTAKFEELSHLVSEKETELATVQIEIESARRVLLEWNDRRNVRVSLPHVPLLPISAPSQKRPVILSSFSGIDDSIDFSRCSITAFLRIYVYPLDSNTSTLVKQYHDIFRNSHFTVANAASACLFIKVVDENVDPSLLAYWGEYGRNHILVNVGNRTIQPLGASFLLQNAWKDLPHNALNIPMAFNAPATFDWTSAPRVLPFRRKYLLSFFVNDTLFVSDINSLLKSANQSLDEVIVAECSGESLKCHDLENSIRSSTFTIIEESSKTYLKLMEALRLGSIPVVLSTDVKLPLEECLDWKLAAIRIPRPRFPELHFLLRSIPQAEVLELRRRGRLYLENYFGTRETVVRSLLACISQRLGLLSSSSTLSEAVPLFDNSFEAPVLLPVNVQTVDEEFLGPLEAPVASPQYAHNFTSLQLYSSNLWSSGWSVDSAPEFIPFAFDHPSESEFDSLANLGFRAIEPGSGREFSQALGGNRPREQFTVVMVTFQRDEVLTASLERLHKLPYLNKVVVIWNNVGREPPRAWPRLHVPVEFIRAPANSLNNRFVPWDRIETEAVLSIDDDVDLTQHEIVFAFRVWRENRDRIVGFPARHHARYGNSMFYNSNHTCQLSIVLTGAAFIHKAYFHAYTHHMPADIRNHVNAVTNCEDIAMNFLVSHLTRKPPIKTTSKWTLRCPTCTETLSNDDSHFTERHECIRLFTKIYGYNPLKFSQFRADSMLYKTRVPVNAQKCFRFV